MQTQTLNNKSFVEIVDTVQCWYASKE